MFWPLEINSQCVYIFYILLIHYISVNYYEKPTILRHLYTCRVLIMPQGISYCYWWLYSCSLSNSVRVNSSIFALNWSYSGLHSDGFNFLNVHPALSGGLRKLERTVGCVRNIAGSILDHSWSFKWGLWDGTDGRWFWIVWAAFCPKFTLWTARKSAAGGCFRGNFTKPKQTCLFNRFWYTTTGSYRAALAQKHRVVGQCLAAA